MINLWEIRNEEVHDKEEKMKQQKRKAKAAITVQAQHNLQEKACPSNSFLFYSDVEKEKKNATAAKLEGFIAMKNRSLHNSVSKWADRATNKVKSIVELIKTGKKNNRAVLKRLEKRDRDHFRITKRTRNHRRKRKEGTVQYIPQ